MKARKSREAAQAAPFPGFVCIGRFVQGDDRPVLLDAGPPQAAGVYVFVLDGVVVYVGTARNLKHRLASYARRRQDYRRAIFGQIGDALEAGSEVTVWIAEAPSVTWNGMKLYLTLDLEASLIRHFRPSWNIRS